MDVKFPVDNYLRYLESERVDDQQKLAAQFKRDVRARVKELTTRGYADPTNTLGFVLLFGSFFVELIVDENELNKNSHWRGGEEIGGEVAFAMSPPKPPVTFAS